MGGGVGLSAHASHRLVTERSLVAMPEVGIGFVPDVGGTYLLARAPGKLGTHAALTASRLGPSDAILCGLADRFIESGRLASVPEALRGFRPGEEVWDRLGPLLSAPPAGVLPEARGWIDACYRASERGSGSRLPRRTP